MQGKTKPPVLPGIRRDSLKQLPEAMLLALFMFVVACSPAMTGRGAPPPGGPIMLPQYTSKELLAAMQDRLSLTVEQQKKAAPIIEEHCKKQQEIMGNYTGQEPRGGDCCLRYDLQRLNESTEKQLATFLTEKQMREYQKMQDELRGGPPESGQQEMGRSPDRGGDMRRGGWGGMPPGM